MLKKYPIMCLLVLSTLFLIFVGCDQKDKKTDNSKKTHIITAALASPQYQLYFTGTLLPIKTIPVISRVEGNVTQLFFSYGEKVEKDQKLMIIDSKPLADDYRKTVNDFLQKKQAYMSGQLTYAGNKALYDAGVTSKTTYLSQKASFDNAVLNYLQAKYELEKVLKMANLDPKQIETLSIEDTTAVNAVLQKHFSHIVVVAPGSGVALFPPKKSDSDDDRSVSGQLTAGSAVKEDQLLLSIGDLSGLSATFDVSEINIDLIQKGMLVIVTGSAFPDITLHGVVSTVSAQAKQDSSSSGLSTYSVSVNIPNVSENDMKKIRVGMTAKFEVNIKTAKAILLPIQAVFQRDGKSFVNVINHQGKTVAVPVSTGETTPTQVVITRGIKPGDRVVAHDSI